ncbi:SusC/RagA family TonB-linked outer membrane protein [Mucilaginibacter sp. dw_454]|uniref:SusC/RagA family TonB-linked outer membrane protein n=1 Tax=Mucilaginibacter sp. dw_454 TaxID=2720079 RepID=UPI001BD6BAF7|nr:SusC/RagA family TonB-linked outer membrane protein [Mucilaginibacter sp. dw_454]
MTKKFYKKKCLFYLSVIPILLIILTGKVNAQSNTGTGDVVTISGTVKDDQGPLPGVSVLIKGDNAGVSTNPDGAFTIKAPIGKSITFSMIGYVTQIIPITKANTGLVIVLKNDNKVLNEVTIGYQQVSKRSVTAAITTLDPKVIEDVPAPTFDALLQGRVAGLDVQNFSGEPGVSSTVALRGNTAVARSISSDNTTAAGKASLARAVSGPLYVIDGVPQTTDDIAAVSYGSGTGTDVLAGIPISDIADIAILKDASAAAIYGSRGSSGVIIITTKKGVAGKTKINFSTYHGVTEKPTLDKVLTGTAETDAKLDLIRHYGNYSNLQDLPQILTDSLNPAFNNANDYRKGIYQTGLIDNYDFAISGGNDKVTYRYGLNYYNEDGIVKKSGLKRYTFNTNIGLNLADNLKISTQIRYYRLDRPRSVSDLSGGQSPFTGGYYASSPLPSSNLYLSPAMQDFIYGNTNINTDDNSSNSISFSPTIDWQISKKWAFNTVISYEATNSRHDTYTPGMFRQSGVGYAASFADNQYNYLMSNTLQYNTNLGKDHHINLLMGQNIEYHQYRATDAEADGIPNDQISVVHVVNKNQSTAFSDLQENGIETEFVRLNYDYKSRYFLSAVANEDASSKFGSGNRAGFFPSVSAGWIMSDESFLKDQSWLSMLKLRGSFGITGRQPDDGNNYLAFNNYNVGAGSFPGSNTPSTGQNQSYTYNGIPAISPNFNGGISNKDLTWEHSKETNLGLDLNVFDNRFSFVADAYVKNTAQGIFSLNVPITTGYTTITTNAIGTQSKGLEMTLIAHYFKPTRAFQWETDFNVAFNKTIVTSLPNGGRDVQINGGATSYILRQGQPINQYFLFQQTGVYKTDADVPVNRVTGSVLNFYGYPFKGGDPIWKDQNGDGVLDNNDYVASGNPNPGIVGGINNNFSYKNWSLTVFCTFTLDRTIYNDYLVGKLSHLIPEDDGSSYVYDDIMNSAFPDLSGINYWKNPGDNAKYPSLSSVSGTRYKYAAISSAWLQSGNYLRVKTVTLGYTFKPALVNKIGLSRLRVYGMVDNLHIFQAKGVPDAEAVDAFGDYNGNGYPIPKKFTLGLDLSL